MESITSLIQKNDSRINVEYYDYLWNKIYESETYDDQYYYLRALSEYIYFSIPKQIRKYFAFGQMVFNIVNEAKIADINDLCKLMDTIADDSDLE